MAGDLPPGPHLSQARAACGRAGRDLVIMPGGEGLDLNIGHYYGELAYELGRLPDSRQYLPAGDGTDFVIRYSDRYKN
jgi:hypothetical protein